jgi:3-dehydroquinate synthetase
MIDPPARYTLPDGTREIAVGNAVALPDALRECLFPPRLIVVSDQTVASLLFLPLKGMLERAGFEIVAALVPEGERRKHLKSAERLLGLLLEGGIGQGTGLLAFGGGMVADMAGFAAGTYVHDLPYAQIPTTLVSQVDSLIQRRPALNHPQQRNLIGINHAPRLVWNDPRYLEQLPRRERIAGLCALVARAAGSYPSLFDLVEKAIEQLVQFDLDSVGDVIRHAAYVTVAGHGDYGRDGRPVPRPGDIIADAFGQAGRFRSFRYGEARLLGILAEGYLAVLAGTLERAAFERIRELAARIPLKLSVGASKPWDIIRSLKYDSKSIVRERGIPLLTAVGREGPGIDVDDAQLAEACRWVLKWAQKRSTTLSGSLTS